MKYWDCSVTRVVPPIPELVYDQSSRAPIILNADFNTPLAGLVLGQIVQSDFFNRYTVTKGKESSVLSIEVSVL